MGGGGGGGFTPLVLHWIHTTHAHSQLVVSMCLVIVVCLFVYLLKKQYGIINRDMVLTFT